MAKRYIKIGWENKPSVKTPVNMANLGRMDKGIDDCDNAIEEIYAKRVNNVVTTNEDTFLAGPVGKVLQDQVTELNKNLLSRPFRADMQLDKSTDYDVITTPGVYFYNSWAGDTANGNNQPETAGAIGSMLVLQYGNSYDQILFTTSSKYGIMGRHHGGNTWTTWGNMQH